MKDQKRYEAVLTIPKKTSSSPPSALPEKRTTLSSSGARVARQVPKGRVTSYGAINSSGTADRRHHFKPPEKMERHLKKEGVVVKDIK